MSDDKLVSISDFARYSRTTRDTLLHYDRIGLLSPISRGENNYRYYSNSQLAVINVIRTCRKLGMTLDEIKNLKDRRTPEIVDEVFTNQIEKIDKNIEEWIRARKLLLSLKKSIQSVSDIDEDEITIQFVQTESIILGEENDYSNGRTFFDTLLSFYESIGKKYPDLDLDHLVWGFFSAERVKRGDWIGADRFYCYNPEGYDERPSALYAVGYMRGGYGDGDRLFKRIIDYIKKNNFEISGPAYVEFPLNEVFIKDPGDYLMRILITVREASQ